MQIWGRRAQSLTGQADLMSQLENQHPSGWGAMLVMRKERKGRRMPGTMKTAATTMRRMMRTFSRQGDTHWGLSRSRRSCSATLPGC